MKKAIELLLSDTLYMVSLVLCGTYFISQKEYTLAYVAMASFVVVAVRKAVKSKSK